MTEILNRKLIDTKKSTDILVTILVIIGALLVPTFLAHVFSFGKYQQIITGTIVNASLILSAIYLKGTIKTLAIATLPSVSNILSGILFSSMTLYTKAMIPAIWIGNFSLIFMYKCLFLNKNTNYYITSIIAIVLKSAIIYSGFLLMGMFINIPDKVNNVLSVSMGYTQVITATCGSLFAYAIIKITTNKKVIKY